MHIEHAKASLRCSVDNQSQRYPVAKTAYRASEAKFNDPATATVMTLIVMSRHRARHTEAPTRAVCLASATRLP